MSFDRIREPGEWVNGTPIDASEMDALDARQPGILDGASGGSWAPTQSITVGGKGIQDAYQQHVAPTITSGSATVNNIEAHRTWVTGVAAANAYLTFQFKADDEGTSRELMVEELGAGVTVVLRDENNDIMSHGQWKNHDPSTLLIVKIERVSGAWVCTHRASDQQTLFKIYEADAVQGPDRNPLPAVENLYGPDDGAGRVLFFTLPSGVSGMVRRVRFKRLLPFSEVLFESVGASSIVYNVGGGGEINVTIELMYALWGWRITNVIKNVRPQGELTLPLSSIPEDPVAVDTDIYSVVAVNTPLTNTGNNAKFTLKDPLFEHQTLSIYFQAVTGVDQAPQIEVRPASALNSVIYAWDFSVFRANYYSYPYAPTVQQWGGGFPMAMHFRVIDGHWQYIGFTP